MNRKQELSRFDGEEILNHLSEDEIAELINNREVTCLLLHSKSWKYYALCQIPYRLLKSHHLGRYEWKDTTSHNFEDKVVRLRHNYKELLIEPEYD